MKKILFVIILGAFSLQANAGFWDSIGGFFSGSGDSAETPATSSQITTPNSTAAAVSPSMVQTGLQLLPLLTKTLGVSNNQAEGGMGAILQVAKTLLSGTEYGSLVNAIPNVDSLLAAAPALAQSSKSQGGLLNSALDMASEYSETARTGSQLVSQFQSLGLKPDMIPKFSEVTSNYLKQSDNAGAGALLTTAISSIL